MTKEIVVKIHRNTLYLDPNFGFDTKKLRTLSGVSFKYEGMFFWKIQASWESDCNTIKAIVVDYDCNPEEYLDFPRIDLNLKIASIEFRELSWNGIEHQLSSWFNDWTYEFTNREKPKSEIVIAKQINHAQTSEQFEVLYKNASINNGSISFYTTIDGKKILGSIGNAHLLREFDSVKYLFHKITGNKRFLVNAILRKRAGVIEIESAVSSDIDRIDDGFVKNIYIQKTKEILRACASRGLIESPAVSLDEIFNLDPSFSKLVNLIDEKQKTLIFEDAVSKGVRNKEHLRYLSGKWHDANEKLLFTHKREKGFIFTIKNESSTIYCWELFDSHATYIWVYKPKSDEKPLYLLMQEIRQIELSGRREYKKQSNKPGLHVICHSEINMESRDSFENWKKAICEYLIENTSKTA